MKAGFYTDYGVHGCCSCPWQTNGKGANQSFGDDGYISKDMAQLAVLKTDYIKVDSCQPVNWRDGKPDDAAQYGRFRDAIAAAGRPMVYSIVGFKGSIALASPGDDYSWLNATGNSWRTSQDIVYAWSKIMVNLDAQENVPGIEQLAGPGGFNDLDMLMTFNAQANLTAVEDASHLALWAILKSPLLISTDVAALTSTQLAMLTNARMLNVSQDALGAQATRVAPRARFAAGGAVSGASKEDGYATGPHQWWTLSPMASGAVRFENEGSRMCLGRSAQGDGVELAACTAPPSVVGWHYAGAAEGACARITSATEPSKCLSLAAVAGTSEFRRATLAPCDDASLPLAGQWSRPGEAKKYLNLTVESLASCAFPTLQLDAAPRAATNVFAGPLEGNRWAALLFNRGDVDASITLDFALLPGSEAARRAAEERGARGLELEATEVWSGKALGSFAGALTSKPLRAHESLFVILAAV
jgi:hypothetical protein